MKRILVTVGMCIIIGLCMAQDFKAPIEPEKYVPPVALVKVVVPQYMNHNNINYTFNSLDGKINFTYSWCLEDALRELFGHQLFNKIDKRYLENFSHIKHSESLNEGITRGYILFGKAFNVGFGKEKSYVLINTRLEHFLPTGLKVIVWHEMMHILLGRGGHCYGINCPVLSKSGANSSIEGLSESFGKRDKRLFLEYIIDLQKDWEKI